MLGHEAAGKTSYLSAMYEEMNGGSEGFTVRAQRPADHQRLMSLARHIRSGTYPPPNARRSNYLLRLHHAGQPIFDFVWRDYRGGALTETSDSAQASQLRADAAAAGGLVLTIDSTRLTSGPRAQAHVRPLIATTVKLLRERQETTALVIALTKWDLVADQDAAARRARDLLGDLIAAVGATDDVYGLIIPVACGPQAVNVIFPVLWCLHVGIAIRGRAIQRNVAYYQHLQAVARQRGGVVDRVRSWYRGEPTWTVVAAQLQVAADLELASLRPLITASQQLAPAFEDAVTF